MNRSLFAALSTALFAAVATAQIAPNGVPNGNFQATHYSANIPYTFGTAGVSLVNQINLVTLGPGRPFNRAQFVFDAQGNVYWHGFNGSALASMTRDGVLRWSKPLGMQANASPIVVGNAVYFFGRNFAAAWNKDTGDELWRTSIPGMQSSSPSTNQNARLNPVFHNGKVYVVSEWKDNDLSANGGGQAITDRRTDSVTFYQLDAATGAIDYQGDIFVGAGNTDPLNPDHALLREDQLPQLQLTLVPDAFGANQHGLYFNVSAGNALDPNSVYAVKADRTTNSFSLAWQGNGGHVGRSHLMYSQQLNLLIALTWSDYGDTVYFYNPQFGFVNSYRPDPRTGFGFFEAHALGPDGRTIIGGGFSGRLPVYRVNDDFGADVTTIPNETVHYYGEWQQQSNLINGPNGTLIFISGTTRGIEVRDDAALPAGFPAPAPYGGTRPFFTNQIVGHTVTAVQINPADGYSARQLWTWNVPTFILDANGDPRGGPALSPDGQRIYVALANGTMYILGPRTGAPQSTLRGQFNETDPANIEPSGSRTLNPPAMAETTPKDFTMERRVPLHARFYTAGRLGDPTALLATVNTTIKRDGSFDLFTDLTGTVDICLTLFSPASTRNDTPIGAGGLALTGVVLADEVNLGSGLQLVGGDTDGNGMVDDADLTNIILDFGAAGGSSSGFAGTDVNNDGTVDDGDLTILILNFGGGCPF